MIRWSLKVTIRWHFCVTPGVFRELALTGCLYECSVDAVNPHSPGGRRYVSVAGELRDALGEHGKAAGRPWKARVSTEVIRHGPGKSMPAVRIELDEDEARALARLISTAARCPGGDPGQVRSAAPTLLSVPEAARLTGHPEGTIRAWVCRKGPQRNPFPRPVPGNSGDRMRFDQLEVEAWMAGRTKPPAQRRPSAAEDKAT